MKVGFASAILPDLSFEAVIDQAAAIGYSCVEIMSWPVGKAERRYAGVTHCDVTDFTQADADKLLAYASGKGIELSALGYYPNILSGDAEESEVAVTHLKRVIAASKLLGLGKVNTFIGRDHTKSIDDNWPRFLEIWPAIIQFAEEQGIYVGIENCPMLFTNDEWPGGKNLAISPKIWERMFEAIPSANFGLNYDPSHMIWQQMDYLTPIEVFKEKLFHIHIKDVRMDWEAMKTNGILSTPLTYHSPVIPGRGEIDWSAFFNALRAVGYEGPVCLEVEDRDYEESLERRIDALKDGFKAIQAAL